LPSADSLRQVADHSSELQLRTGESFGALWTVDQIARKLGIQKALGVTEAAELGYWQVLARVLPAILILVCGDSAGRASAGRREDGQRPKVRVHLFVILL
jgi:hypothetical protein